jgi:manganese transport protein
VIGTAIGLNLLFGLPIEIGVIITAADVFIILAMQSFGFRWVETFVVALLAVIAACFTAQIVLADPDWGAVIRGFTPSVDILTDRDKLYLSLGILGATVMPHNLYLHSALVRTRAYDSDTRSKLEAIRFATIDSTLALTMALAINASILILAASTFHKVGQTDVTELDQAYRLLAPTLGSSLAPTLFAVALIACGLNSTVTATLSGQVVMEGFVKIRLKPWLRRMLTRVIAIVPAAVVTVWAGQKGMAQLLILSQVILSLQLPFAVVPLVMFTASRSKMGAFTAPRWLTAVAVVIVTVIVALNVKLVTDTIAGWMGF